MHSDKNYCRQVKLRNNDMQIKKQKDRSIETSNITRITKPPSQQLPEANKKPRESNQSFQLDESRKDPLGEKESLLPTLKGEKLGFIRKTEKVGREVERERDRDGGSE